MIEMLVKEINKNPDKIKDFIKENAKIKSGFYLNIDIDKPFNADSFKDYIVVGDSHTFIDGECVLEYADKLKLANYFADRDISTGLLNGDTNKAIDPPIKRCLSTSYLTLAVAGKTLPYGGDGKFETTDEIVEHWRNKVNVAYLNIGKTISTSWKISKLKDNLDDNARKMIQEANREDRKIEIELINEYLSKNLDSIFLFLVKKGINAGSYLKLFFYSSSGKIDDSLEAYSREEMLYLGTCLLNKNTVAINDGEIKGTITYGFNVNKDKIGLNPTMMSVNYTNTYTFEEAIGMKLAHEFLTLMFDCKGTRAFAFDKLDSKEQFNLNIDDLFDVRNKSMLFKMALGNNSKHLDDYDLRATIERKGKTMAIREVTCINFLNNRYEFKKIPQDKEVATNVLSVKDLLAFIMFSRKEALNIYRDYAPFGIGREKGAVNFENKASVLFNKNKYIIDEFLRSLNPSKALIKRIDEITKDYIMEYIKAMGVAKNFEYGLSDLLNARYNLINYLGERDNVMLNKDEIVKKVLEKIKNNEDLVVKNDEEYYFLVGQIARYLEGMTKGKRTMEVYKYYVSKQSDILLMRQITKIMEKYAYSLSDANRFFNAVYIAICTYIPKTNIFTNAEAFYVGVLSDNMFYTKKTNDIEEVEE